jgi:polygalacturonase
MKKYISSIILLLFTAFQVNAQTSANVTDNNVSWATADEILSRIKEPTFQDKDFYITKYGAVEGGRTDCTDAIRKAIDACNAAGGGRVIFPEGAYLTGAIRLKVM